MSLNICRTTRIAICAGIALLCASCATTARFDGEEKEALTPQKRSQLYAEMGTAAMMRGDFPQAVEDLRKAIVADDENTGAHNNLALAYWQLGKKSLAKAEIKRSLEIDPNFSDSHINQGTFLASEGRTAEAKLEYQKAADNLEFKARHRALTSLAELALRENNTDEARKLLYQSLQANPDFCMSHFLLGSILMRDNNPRAAAEEFNKSVRATCVANVEGHYQLGLAYLKTKDFDKARTQFVLLIDHYPETLQAQRAGDQLKYLP